MSSVRTYTGCILLALGAAACNNKSSVITPDRLAGVSQLGAYSVNSSTVGLSWTATSATNTGYMEDHEVVVQEGEDSVQVFTLPISATTATIQALTEGTVYSFAVTVRANDTSPYKSSAPITINWSPAKRFTTEAGTSSPIRLYESASTGNMHALRFYADSLNGPQLISLSSSERSTMDVYLLTAPAGVTLWSGELYEPPAGRSTKFAELEPVEASSLDHPRTFAPSEAFYTRSSVNIPTELTETGLIFFARTEDNHYVRILVVRDGKGSLIAGTAPDRYITVRISYQSVPGVPYAEQHTAHKPSQSQSAG